jgi:hypothetical protein
MKPNPRILCSRERGRFVFALHRNAACIFFQTASRYLPFIWRDSRGTGENRKPQQRIARMGFGPAGFALQYFGAGNRDQKERILGQQSDRPAPVFNGASVVIEIDTSCGCSLPRTGQQPRRRKPRDEIKRQ